MVRMISKIERVIEGESDTFQLTTNDGLPTVVIPLHQLPKHLRDSAFLHFIATSVEACAMNVVMEGIMDDLPANEPEAMAFRRKFN